MADNIPTPEELEKRREEIEQSMWGQKPKKEAVAPQTKTDVAPAVAPPQPPPASPAPATAAPPAVQPPVQPAAQPVNVSAIAKAAATEAVLAMETVAPAGAPTVVAASEKIEMTDDDARDYEVVQFLERTQPEKYSGKSKAFVEFVKANYAYQDEWSAKNPGREFDPTDEEHNTWYDKHPSPLTDKEIDAGRESMIEERVFNNRVKPELDKLREKERQAESERKIQLAMPTIAVAVHGKILSLAKSVSPDIAAVLVDAGGKPNFSKEALDKAADVDAIAFEELSRAVKLALEPVLVELEKSVIDGADYVLNPRQNPVHAQIANIVSECEADILKRQPNDQLRGGKQFVPISRMQSLEDSIIKSNASKESKDAKLRQLEDAYWCVGVSDIEDFYVNQLSEQIKSRISHIDGLARKKYKQPSQPSGEQPQPQPVQITPSTAAVPSSQKPNPPSATHTSEAVHNSHLSKPGGESFSEMMEKTHFKK